MAFKKMLGCPGVKCLWYSGTLAFIKSKMTVAIFEVRVRGYPVCCDARR